MKQAGLSWDDISSLRIGDVQPEGTSFGVHLTSGRVALVGPLEVAQGYLTRRSDLGLDCSLDSPLITDLRGEPVPAAGLETFLVRARTSRVSLEATGAFCSALLQQRNGEKPRVPTHQNRNPLIGGEDV